MTFSDTINEVTVDFRPPERRLRESRDSAAILSTDGGLELWIASKRMGLIAPALARINPSPRRTLRPRVVDNAAQRLAGYWPLSIARALSPREEEVMRLVAWSMRNKDIALRLALGVKTETSRDGGTATTFLLASGRAGDSGTGRA